MYKSVYTKAYISSYIVAYINFSNNKSFLSKNKIFIYLVIYLLLINTDICIHLLYYSVIIQ